MKTYTITRADKRTSALVSLLMYGVPFLITALFIQLAIPAIITHQEQTKLADACQKDPECMQERQAGLDRYNAVMGR